jgi:hypothetical protein
MNMDILMVSNIVTALLCLAVLVQSARLMRGLKSVRKADLGESVKVLDQATGAARSVLGELKAVLENEGRANCTTVDEAQKIRDELGMLINLADSMAERLVDAASRTQTARSDTARAFADDPDRPSEANGLRKPAESGGIEPRGAPRAREKTAGEFWVNSVVLPVKRRPSNGFPSAGNPAALRSGASSSARAMAS